MASSEGRWPPENMKRLSLLLLLALGSAGCATVPPYEREYLSRPGMDSSRRVAEMRFETHVHNSREASAGGESSAGGGCGCN